jgi:hypothetical protein
MNEITYFGYVINENGLRLSEDTIESVVMYPILKCVKDKQGFLGLNESFNPFKHIGTCNVPHYFLLIRHNGPYYVPHP